MAKVAFSKLETKICDKIYNVTVHTAKGEEIQYEVKHYLPMEEKLEMISRIINQSVDDNGFYNPMRIKMFTVLEIMYTYTNLSFTAKQKENLFKLYDQLVSSGLFNKTIDCIWEEDWKEINETILTTIENIYKYKNSAAGIIETISADYSSVNMDLNSIQEKLADPNALQLIKEILPLMNIEEA